MSLGQPIHSDSGGSHRLAGIMTVLAFIMGLGAFFVIRVMPDSEAALAEDQRLRQIATERSVTLTEQGVAFISCAEVTCEEAQDQFFRTVGIGHPFELAKTVMDSSGQPVGYLYVDRRLQLVTIVE